MKSIAKVLFLLIIVIGCGIFYVYFFFLPEFLCCYEKIEDIEVNFLKNRERFELIVDKFKNQDKITHLSFNKRKGNIRKLNDFYVLAPDKIERQTNLQNYYSPTKCYKKETLNDIYELYKYYGVTEGEIEWYLKELKNVRSNYHTIEKVYIDRESYYIVFNNGFGETISGLIYLPDNIDVVKLKKEIDKCGLEIIFLSGNWYKFCSKKE